MKFFRGSLPFENSYEIYSFFQGKRNKEGFDKVVIGDYSIIFLLKSKLK
ncbi:hypothetical protein LEP1GSC172_4427 [Leptospira noguchii]|uniref:Uncharacterized protein n=2 Tax=Leptospira noguchii TaxID=28182 RepID=T0FNW4_9LEPT|nr:hypothetical protein LEP1GSC172_4427 [Leptospira noguchii]EQA71195.1 hypothetical protein LEP1GSC059_1272 [Leptospira noguchii serovar Panama str. CZ214]